MYPDVPVWGKGAILTDAWFILLSQVIVSPIVNTCNPYYFLYVIKKRGALKAVEDPNSEMTQTEAHTRVEKPIWDPAFSFAGMINVFYTMIFLQPLLPLSSCFGFATFTLMYWSHKHRLLRMSVKPVTLSDSIAQTSLYMISLGAMVYGVDCHHLG